ncbi:unnamed protein product [Paramecium sonneborni]|uniref:WD40-repeat-containing domain n=1 Tax=Paramecium sonneborni TaxID=65129 RepID=A0A8S1PFK9_9CILI|nr:unnamed protein product [Paramecium sonneborni]
MLRHLYFLDNCFLYKKQEQKLLMENSENKIVFSKINLQSQMIEKEMQLNCKQKHNQKIEKVSLDPEMQKNEKLLCYQCLFDMKQDQKKINYRATIQVIEEKQQQKNIQLEKILNDNLKQIEQLQRDINIFKNKLVQQCNKIIQSINEWILNIQQLGRYNAQYSIYDEIDNIIKNDKTIFPKQQELFSQINQLNQQYLCNIINEIQNLNYKEVLIKSCDDFKQELININLDLDKQVLKIQEQKNNEESYLIQINRIEKQLKQQQSNGIVKLIPIKILNLQKTASMPGIFNYDSSLLITSDYLNNISVWNFEDGKQNELTTFSVGKAIRKIICSKKCNSFITGLNGGGIYIWKQINNKEWKRSEKFKKHEFWINDMILNKAEDQLFSGGEDPYINIWTVDYLNNELSFLYNLDSKTINIYSFSFNDSENLLISCSVIEIIIWEKLQSNKWKYLCNQKMEPYFQAKFLKDNCFCILPINQKISSISIYEIYTGILKEIEDKKIELIKDNDWEEKMNFPILYNKLKNILIIKSKRFIYFIRQLSNGSFEIVNKIIVKNDVLRGILSDDGQYLVFFEPSTMSQITYELLYE